MSERMTTNEAAEYLGISPKTLISWRYKGMFELPYVKIGRKVFYEKDDLDAWLEGRRVTPKDYAASGTWG